MVSNAYLLGTLQYETDCTNWMCGLFKSKVHTLLTVSLKHGWEEIWMVLHKLFHPIVSDQKRCLSSPNQNFSNFPTSVLAFLPPTFLNFFLWIFEPNLAFNWIHTCPREIGIISELIKVCEALYFSKEFSNKVFFKHFFFEFRWYLVWTQILSFCDLFIQLL